MTSGHIPPQIGTPAPNFVLPVVDREGTVSLTDYRGKHALLLALFRGLYCPFCRHAIAQFGSARGRLRAAGVEALGVVATTVDNARLYFRYRPAPVPLAADPELTTHRAYGVPQPALTPELLGQLASVKINPTGELPTPLPVLEATATLDRIQGFRPTDTDQADSERHGAQLCGQFLIDRAGILRWANVECAAEGLAGLGKFPSPDELLAAAAALQS